MDVDLEAAMHRAELAMHKAMNETFYGPNATWTPPPPPTRWQKWRTRISDAWGVLTGRLEVGGDW